MSDDVTKPRQEYLQRAKFMRKNRLAVAGHRKVQEAGTDCLKPLASMYCSLQVIDGMNTTVYDPVSLSVEGEKNYQKYKDNAYFLGATGATVGALSGLITSRPLQKYNIPGAISFIEDNVDGRGKTLKDFSGDIIQDAFPSTWSGILVARPATPSGTNKLQEEKGNYRPKLLHYKFESIINWHFEVINNVEMLSLLVLKEECSTRKGFEIEVKPQYRVLELIGGVYHQSVYDDCGKLHDEGSMPVVFNGKTQTEIPFYWIVPESEDKSVMDDMIDANYQHYKLYADYGSKLHYSSFIIWTENNTESGQTNNISIGNGVKWNGNEGATFNVLQANGNADSHRLALSDTEQRMAALGMDMLRPTSGSAESAEAKRLDQVGQNSRAGNVALTVSSAIERALNFASRTMGGTEDAEYLLSTDYDPTDLNPQLITSLAGSVTAEIISKQTAYEKLQEGEIANPSRTFEEEQVLITKENSGNNDI